MTELIKKMSVKRMAVIGIAAMLVPAAHAQFAGGIVFDPTQSAHAITEIAQGTDIISNGVQLAATALQTYQLALTMSMAPSGLYAGWMSPSTYWMLLEQTANTYGNSQPVMDTSNNGMGADGAWQTASVPRQGMLPEYGTLSIQGQQQLAASEATTDLSDSVAQSNLTTLGTMRANEIQREADLENLEAESQSMDPAQQTTMATEQRINQALLLSVRQQQEANQLQQALALQQLVTAKQEQDILKAKDQDAIDYGANFQTNIAPVYGGADAAQTY